MPGDCHVGFSQIPPAAERLVDVDVVVQEVEARPGERDLRREEQLHRVEHFEVVREAAVVAHLREANHLAISVDGRFELGHGGGDLRPGVENRGRLRECSRHDLLVEGFRLLPLRVSRGVLALDPAPLKQRAEKAGGDRPGLSGRIEEIVDLGGDGAEEAGQAETGEEVRERDPDEGIRGDEILFGLTDVGAPQEQLRGKAGRHVRRQRRVSIDSPRGTGAGFRPRSRLSWFSRASIPRSISGICAATCPSAASA